MNWIKLNQDYPKAYKLMETEFNCLYTHKSESFIMAGEIKTSETIIKHPLKRDLYEFFDGLDILISVYSLYSHTFLCDIKQPNSLDVLYELPQKNGTTRLKAETEAFTKAFEILNDRLK